MSNLIAFALMLASAFIFALIAFGVDKVSTPTGLCVMALAFVFAWIPPTREALK